MHDFLTPLYRDARRNFTHDDLGIWDEKYSAYIKIGHALGILPHIKISDDCSRVGFGWEANPQKEEFFNHCSNIKLCINGEFNIKVIKLACFDYSV
jgi:hypothetical protein